MKKIRTLNTHTIPLPTDYVSELRNQGKRKKSRAFMEYFYDMEVGEHNSYSFYAKSWEVGKGTAHRWIKEFNEALEIFDAARELKRQVCYQKATSKTTDKEVCKKSGGTIGTIEMERLEHPQSTYSREFVTIDETIESNAVELSFIINNNKDNEQHITKDFYLFINEIKMSIKNVGNIDEIYKAYQKVKTHLDLATLSKAYRAYARETKSDRKVGLVKFLDDLMFLAYVKPYIELYANDDVYLGVFDKENETLHTKTKTYTLSLDRYSELYLNDKIKILKYT